MGVCKLSVEVVVKEKSRGGRRKMKTSGCEVKRGGCPEMGEVEEEERAQWQQRT